MSKYNHKNNQLSVDQLGLTVSAARNRLIIDLLYAYACKEGVVCYRCGKAMDRSSFSIEHKKAWLHEPNAKDLYFDLENVTFSHKLCNGIAARKPPKKEVVHGTASGYQHYGCRCDACKLASREYKKNYYTPEKRAAKYKRTGT